MDPIAFTWYFVGKTEKRHCNGARESIHCWESLLFFVIFTLCHFFPSNFQLYFRDFSPKTSDNLEWHSNWFLSFTEENAPFDIFILLSQIEFFFFFCSAPSIVYPNQQSVNYNMMSPLHLPQAPQHHQHAAQPQHFYQVSADSLSSFCSFVVVTAAAVVLHNFIGTVNESYNCTKKINQVEWLETLELAITCAMHVF